jgi:diguanylate cyclase (GGDEF)-like protein/PAS domain S-box-containing protein
MRAETTDIYRAFFDAAPDAVVAVDADGRIVDANAQVTALFGYERDELLGQPVEILLPARYRDGHATHRSRYAARPTRRPMGAGLDLWGRHREGIEFPVDVSLSPATGDGAQLTLAAIRDVTARRRNEQELRASERRFRMVFEDAPFGMAMIDRRERLRQVNDALCRLLEGDPGDLINCSIADLTPPEDSARYVELLGQLFDGALPRVTLEKRFQTRTGRVVWAEVTFSALGAMGDEDALAVTMVEDITARKQAEARLTHLATHDELTGLANRSLLTDRLRQAQARSARSGQVFAVLFVDLDGFKRVNDDLGHQVGDAVLAEVGRRIESAVRPVDTAARHGGDEFVLCCEDLGGDEPAARRAIDEVVSRLLAVLAEPIAAAGHDVTTSACVGVVLARGDGATPAGLIAEADGAMYRAKSTGRGRAAFAGDPA